MRPRNVSPHRAARARRAGHFAIVGSLAAACFVTPVIRADTTKADEESAAVGSPAVKLRMRYAGSYRFAGDAAEQRARADAIDRSVAAFFFAFRGIARAKVADRTTIVPTCKFEFSGGTIRSTVPGHPVAVSPETGAPVPYRVDDEAIVLSQRFEGERLVQVFRADDGGSRTNEFMLSPDGARLTMKATVSSPRLSIPVVYTLTYQRVD
ncbi:MAG: hypothetical protein ABSF69_16025 [Polyangiaceae bacterium]|jgi:hypothetical protein